MWFTISTRLDDLEGLSPKLVIPKVVRDDI